MKRSGWERTKLAAALALPLVTIAVGLWSAGLVMAPVYPERRGYPVEGVPPVDLASAQRTWPAGESRPGQRELLLGYVRNIQHASVPIREGAPAPAPAAPLDLGLLLAAADPARGERTASVCTACHSFEAGGPDRVGPNLHAIVGRPVAARAGFAFSPALTAAGGRWDYAALDRFLASPARAVPGTKMSFAGLRNPRDRAHLIAWLARQTPGAPPFPAPATVTTAPPKAAR